MPGMLLHVLVHTYSTRKSEWIIHLHQSGRMTNRFGFPRLWGCGEGTFLDFFGIRLRGGYNVSACEFGNTLLHKYVLIIR